MGSQSDWATMRHAAAVLDELRVGYAARIVSAHRTPERLYAFAKGARDAGVKVIVAGAGGAAHLPGMIAALTTLPVLGVPVESKALRGVDSLYSIVQMPGGIPVGTLAIGRAGAINAALLAAAILALADPAIDAALVAWRARQTEAVAETPDDGTAVVTTIAPGGTIGILGGGQLGRMAAMAAARLGYRCHIFAPEDESPAADVAAAWTRADYDDEAALARFAAAVDVVTLEFENVPVATAEFLARHRPVRPSAAVLRVTQDRLAEKDFVRALGIPVTAYARIESAADLALAREQLGHGVLKTVRMGYDGKGQLRVDAGTDLDAAIARLGQPVLIHEAWVEFALELSVVTARNPHGAVASYVPVENRHRDHILDVTIAPAAIPADAGGTGGGHGRADRAGAGAGGAARGRDVPDPRRPPAGQRAGAAAAQFRPLDDRRLRRQPVRAAGARGVRPAAGRSRPASPTPRCAT